MNKLFKIVFVAGFATMFLTSCLKDTPVSDYSDKAIKPLILIPNGNWPRTTTVQPLALELKDEPYELRLYARVSWDKPLGRSLDVTFIEDDAIIAAYKTQFPSSNWVKMNSDAYSVPSNKITIPAGATEAFIPVQVFTKKINLAQNNMLAFTITDASGEVIASNFKSLVAAFLVKNAYDADYTATGYFFHPTGGRAINMTKHIYSVSDVTSQVQLGDLAGYEYRFDVSGTSTLTNYIAMGSTPTGTQSGFMTQDEPGGSPGGWLPAPAVPGVAPWLHSTYNNTYNAATKTFFVHTGYGVGAANQAGFSRQQYEKWVRK